MNDDINTAHAKVTNLLSRLYRGVPREDISQEAWLGFYSSEWALDGPVRPVEGDTEGDVWDQYWAAIKAVKKEMRSTAEKYCRKEKAALEGYRIEDEQYYSIGSLRVLLEAWFVTGVTEAPPKSFEHSVSRPTRTAGQGDYLVSLVDVGAALRRLPTYQRVVLYQGYGPDWAGLCDDDIASELRIPLATWEGRIRRALTGLQRELGGAIP